MTRTPTNPKRGLTMKAIPYNAITNGTGIQTNTLSSAANENRITKGPVDGTVMPDYRLLAWLEAQMRRTTAGLNTAAIHGILERLKPIALGTGESRGGLTRDDVLAVVESLEERIENAIRVEMVDAAYSAIAETNLPQAVKTHLKGRVLERLFSHTRRRTAESRRVVEASFAGGDGALVDVRGVSHDGAAVE